MARRSTPVIVSFCEAELVERLELTHDISLGTDGNQTIDVLADGDQDLAGHVSALLGSGGLVLNVNTSGTLLDEKLGELHDGGQTAVAGIGISNDGAEVVDVGDLGAVTLGVAQALLALLAVVEQLGHEKMADLVGDGGLQRISFIFIRNGSFRTYHGVISQIRAGLVRRGSCGGRLPSRDVDGVEVLGHLGNHDGVETAIGEAGVLVLSILLIKAQFEQLSVESSYLETALNDLPELLCLRIAGVLNLQVAPLLHNLLRSERPASVAPS